MPLQDAIYRFGPYELRTRTHEVYKNGEKLKLRPQAFQILHALVERSGDVVTREELRRRLWPAETFVDFEHGLNTAIKELRGLLNDSASEPRYIETLPKLGYRIIAPVTAVEAVFRAPFGDAVDAKSRAAEIEEPQGRQFPDHVGINSHRPLQRQEEKHRSKDRQLQEHGGVPPPLHQWRWGIAAAVGVIVIVGVAIYVQWSRSRARVQAPSTRAMLAVLPFENLTGDAGQEYFSDGLTEEMIGQLGRLDSQRLGVIARTSVMHYKHTQDPLSQIGRELGVQYVLEGSVRRDSDKVRISAQLIQVRDQTHIWSRQYDRELGSLLTLQGEIAREAAGEIQIALGTPQSMQVALQNPSASTANSEAHDLYLKGLYFWNKRTVENFEQAVEYFRRATDRDPNYAPAYSGLADSYSLLTGYAMLPGNKYMPRARAAALRALELDQNLAEAHTALALVVQNYDYDWQTSEKEFRWAIELNPNYVTAHHWYAEHLMWMGRFDEALQESEKARQLDPLSLIIAADYGDILYNARQYDQAIAQLRAVREMDPNFPRATIILGPYIQKGMFKEALALVKPAPPSSPVEPWYLAAMASIYGRAGQRDEALRVLKRLEELNLREPLPLTVLVSAYLSVGDQERALTYLEKEYAERCNALTTLKVDPEYDPLRSDPRFQALLRRMNFPQ